jgi:hypothetical protein
MTEKELKEKEAAAAKAVEDLNAAKKKEQDAAMDVNVQALTENKQYKIKMQEAAEKLAKLREKAAGIKETLEAPIEPVLKEGNKIPPSSMTVSELVKQQEDLDKGIKDLKKILENHSDDISEAEKQAEATHQFTITAIEEIKKVEDEKIEAEAKAKEEADAEKARIEAEAARLKEIEEIKQNAGEQEKKLSGVKNLLAEEIENSAKSNSTLKAEISKKMPEKTAKFYLKFGMTAVIVLVCVGIANFIFTDLRVNTLEGKTSAKFMDFDKEWKTMKDLLEMIYPQASKNSPALEATNDADDEPTPEQLEMLKNLQAKLEKLRAANAAED